MLEGLDLLDGIAETLGLVEDSQYSHALAVTLPDIYNLSPIPARIALSSHACFLILSIVFTFVLTL